MRTEQIKALTGVRFFAALWVVVYHSTRANTPVTTSRKSTARSSGR